MHCNENCLDSQCLKLARKVGFNITSEASYIYNFSGQKLVKNAKNGQFGEAEACCQTVARQVNFDRTKIGEKCQKAECDFQGMILKHCEIVLS